MKSRFRKLGVESLEGRSVLSTMVEADFNGDGRLDMAAITNPTTVIVSLANATGGYNVAAVLTSPKTQPMENIYVYDRDGDSNLDVVATGNVSGKNLYSIQILLGNGDGTFDSRTTQKDRWPPPGHHGGF